MLMKFKDLANYITSIAKVKQLNSLTEKLKGKNSSKKPKFFNRKKDYRMYKESLQHLKKAFIG